MWSSCYLLFIAAIVAVAATSHAFLCAFALLPLAVSVPITCAVAYAAALGGVPYLLVLMIFVLFPRRLVCAIVRSLRVFLCRYIFREDVLLFVVR